MKKVFQIKLKSIAKVFTLVVATSLVTFTGCKSYDEDITNLQGQITQVVNDVATLKTSVAALQTSVNGMTYIKSITMGTDGKLTITPSTGTAIVYDAKNYVTYDIALTNNVLTVNGVNKGTVAIPALTFGADNKLMSGTTVVADLSSWVRTLTLSSDNYLMINGVKSTILIPAATVQSVDVKGITISGNVLTITKNDNSTSTITLPQTALTLTAVSSNNGELTLNLNGVDTKVTIKNTYGIDGGFLTVNGVKTTVAIPDGTKNTLLLGDKVNGIYSSVTIVDSTGATMKIMLNPSQELLVGLLFVPKIIEAGVSTVDYGYLLASDNSKTLYEYLPLNFRINPASANLTGISWSFIANSATFRAPSVVPGDVTGIFATPTVVDNNGYAVITLKAVSDPWSGVDAGSAVTGTKRTITLQATTKDYYDNTKTKVITSDYIKVQPVAYKAFVSKLGVAPFTAWPNTKPAIADAGKEIVYNGVQTPLPSVDLDDLVFGTTGTGALPTELLDPRFGKLGVDYYFTYSISDVYLGLDGVTNQNSFVTLDATTNVLTVKAGTASIDRNPLVTVQLKAKSNDKVLATGYIKFDIVRKPSTQTQLQVNYDVAQVNYNYSELFTDGVAGIVGDGKEVIVTWPNMNDNVYNPMGYTHNEYQANYNVNPDTIYVNNVAYTSASGANYTKYKNLLTTSTKAPDVDTYAMKYLVTPETKFGLTTIKYVWDPKVTTPTSKEPIVRIKFTVNVKKPVLDRHILAGYQYPLGDTTSVKTQGMNDGSYKMQLYLGEAFTFGSPAYRNVFGTAIGKVDESTSSHAFAFKVKTPAQSGASLTSSNGTIDKTFGNSTTGTHDGQLLSLTTKLTEDDRVYDMQLITTYPNAETDVFDFKVHFVNPFTIELASPVDFQLIDKVNGTADTQDVKTNYIVKFKGKNIVTKGVAETTDGATTVKAADYVDITNAAYGLFYQLTPGGNYFTISKENGNAYNKDSKLTWDNAGTQLVTEQNVATVKVKFVAPFAEITKAVDDVVTVKPE